MPWTVHYQSINSIHFDVKFKSGGVLNGLMESDVFGLLPTEIEWVYLVEQKRNATPAEIKMLCKRDPMR